MANKPIPATKATTHNTRAPALARNSGGRPLQLGITPTKISKSKTIPNSAYPWLGTSWLGVKVLHRKVPIKKIQRNKKAFLVRVIELNQLGTGNDWRAQRSASSIFMTDRGTS